MHIIFHIGMDVHSTNYTLSTCSLQVDPETGVLEEKVTSPIQINPDYKLVLSYMNRIRSAYPNDTVEFLCGYEAGCLGYSLYNQLTQAGVKCVILAPTTMAVSTKSKVKKNENGTRNRLLSVWLMELIKPYISRPTRIMKSRNIFACVTTTSSL